jgi:hypothetical protein
MAHPSIALPLLLLLAADGGVPVAIGNFNTAKTLPPLTKVERTLPHGDMTKQVEDMIAQKQCTFPGQKGTRFDLSVPYAIRLDANGAATKVVVHDVGCQPLSMLVAKIVVAQAARGDFKIKQGAAENWFGSDVYFKVGEPRIGEALANPDKVSCKSQPVLGSRIRQKRICMTAAQWQQYEKDRQELGRDIRRAGECAGNASCTGG